MTLVKITGKQAWETFILKSAKGAGLTTGRGVIFAAGFIEVVLHSWTVWQPS